MPTTAPLRFAAGAPHVRHTRHTRRCRRHCACDDGWINRINLHAPSSSSSLLLSEQKYIPRRTATTAAAVAAPQKHKTLQFTYLCSFVAWRSQSRTHAHVRECVRAARSGSYEMFVCVCGFFSTLLVLRAFMSYLHKSQLNFCFAIGNRSPKFVGPRTHKNVCQLLRRRRTLACWQLYNRTRAL